MLRLTFRNEKFENFFEIANAILQSETLEEVSKISQHLFIEKENVTSADISVPTALQSVRLNIYHFFSLVCYIRKMQLAAPMTAAEKGDASSLMSQLQKLMELEQDINSQTGGYTYLLNSVMSFTAYSATALLSVMHGNTGKDISPLCFAIISTLQHYLAKSDSISRKLSLGKIDYNYHEFHQGYRIFTADVEPESPAEIFMYNLNRMLVELLLESRAANRHNPNEMIRINALLSHMNLWRMENVRKDLDEAQKKFTANSDINSPEALRANYVPVVFGLFGKIDSVEKLNSSLNYLKQVHQIIEKFYLTYKICDDAKNFNLKALHMCLLRLTSDFLYDIKFLRAVAVGFENESDLVEEIRILEANVALIESCIAQEESCVDSDFLHYAENSISRTSSGLLWNYKTLQQMHIAHDKQLAMNKSINEITLMTMHYHASEDQQERKAIAKKAREQYISCLTVPKSNDYQALESESLRELVNSLLVDAVYDSAYDFLAKLFKPVDKPHIVNSNDAGAEQTLQLNLESLFEQIKLPLQNLHRGQLVMPYVTFAEFLHQSRSLLKRMAGAQSKAPKVMQDEAADCLERLESFCKNAYEDSMREVLAIIGKGKKHIPVVNLDGPDSQDIVTVSEYFELAVAIMNADADDLPLQNRRLQSLPKHPNIKLEGPLALHQTPFNACVDSLHIMLQVLLVTRRRMLNLPVTAEEIGLQKKQLVSLQSKSQARDADTGLVYALKCYVRLAANAVTLILGIDNSHAPLFLTRLLCDARVNHMNFPKHPFQYDGRFTAEYCAHLVEAHSIIFDEVSNKSLYHVFVADLQSMMLSVVFKLRQKVEKESIISSRALEATDLTVKKRQDLLARLQKLAELDSVLPRMNLSSMRDKQEKYRQYQATHPLEKIAALNTTINDQVAELPLMVSSLVFGDSLTGQLKSAIKVLMKRIAMLDISTAAIFINEVGTHHDNLMLVISREHDGLLKDIDLLLSDIEFHPELAPELIREKEVLLLLKLVTKNCLNNITGEYPSALITDMLDLKIAAIKFDEYMNADIVKPILTMILKRFDYLILNIQGMKVSAEFDKYSTEFQYLLSCLPKASREHKLLISRFILEYFHVFAITFTKLGCKKKIAVIKQQLANSCRKDAMMPIFDILYRHQVEGDNEDLFDDLGNLFRENENLLSYQLRALSSRLYSYVNSTFNAICVKKIKGLDEQRSRHKQPNSRDSATSAKIATFLIKDNKAKLQNLIRYIDYLGMLSRRAMLVMVPPPATKAAPVKVEPVVELAPIPPQPVTFRSRSVVTLDMKQGMGQIFASLRSQFKTMKEVHRGITDSTIADEVLDGAEQKLLPFIEEMRASTALEDEEVRQVQAAAKVAVIKAPPAPAFDFANTDFTQLSAHCHADDADECFENIFKLCMPVIDNGKLEKAIRLKAIMLLAQALMYRLNESVNTAKRVKAHKLLNQYLAYVRKNAHAQLESVTEFTTLFEQWLSLATAEQDRSMLLSIKEESPIVVQAFADIEEVTVVIETPPVVAEPTVDQEAVPEESVEDVVIEEELTDAEQVEDDMASESSVHSDETLVAEKVQPELVIANPAVEVPFNIMNADFTAVAERCSHEDADQEFSHIYQLLKPIIFDGGIKKAQRLKAVRLLAQALLHRVDEIQDQVLRDKVVNIIQSNKSYAGHAYAKLFAGCERDIRKYRQAIERRNVVMEEDDDVEFTAAEQDPPVELEADQASDQQELASVAPLNEPVSQVTEVIETDVLVDSSTSEHLTVVGLPNRVTTPPVFSALVSQPEAVMVSPQPLQAAPFAELVEQSAQVMQLENQSRLNPSHFTDLRRLPPALKIESLLENCQVAMNNKLLQRFTMQISPLQQMILQMLSSVQVDTYIYDDTVCASLFNIKPGHMKLACFAAPQFIGMLFDGKVMKEQCHIKEIFISPNGDGLVVRLDEAGARLYAEHTKTTFTRSDLMFEIKCLDGINKKASLEQLCYHQRLNSMLFWRVHQGKLLDVIGNAKSIAVYPAFHMHRQFTVMPELDLCDALIANPRDNREVIFDTLLKLSRHHLYLRFGMALREFISANKHELRDKNRPPFLIELFDELFLTHTASIACRYMRKDRPQDDDLDILYDLFPMLHPEYEVDFRFACAQSDVLCQNGSYHDMTEEAVNQARANFFITAFYRSFMHGKSHWHHIHEKGQQVLMESLTHFLYQMPFELFHPNCAKLMEKIYYGFRKAFENEYFPGFYNAFMSHLNGKSFSLDQEREFSEEYTAFLFQTGVMDNAWLVQKIWLYHVDMLNHQAAVEVSATQQMQASVRNGS